MVARIGAPRADVGHNVRARREAVEMSREQLAATAGVSYDTIRRVERGFVPGGERFARIAAALDTTVEELLKPSGAAA